MTRNQIEHELINPQLTGVTVVGLGESATNPDASVATIHGSFTQRIGRHNPALTSATMFGGVFPYHRLENRAGSGDENGPAELADHSHMVLRSVQNLGVTTAGAARSNPMPQFRQYFQGIATFGSPINSVNSTNSFVLHGGTKDIRGTALTGEISINTTLTSPSGGLSAGNVTFRNSANPNVLAGGLYILEVAGQTVAGIQAAMYNATVVTPSAETSPGSGIWEYVLSVQGLDAAHWTATPGTPGGTQQGLSTLTANYSVAPATVLAVSQIAVPSVSGDPNLLDVTLTSAPPANLIPGHVFSVYLGAGTTITGLTTGTWWPGTVVSVVGSVVRVRVGGSRAGFRYRGTLTIGGTTDTDVTRNVASDGIRDSQHEIPQGEIILSQYRDGNGVPLALGFGSIAFSSAATRSVAVGMDLFVAANDQFVFGTNQVTNRAVLAGNVLSVPTGVNVATAQIRTGTGSPEGVVTAPVSSIYLRTDGGAGTTFYVKESGTGNTGWVAK